MNSESTMGAKAAPSPTSGKPQMVPPTRLVPITTEDRGPATFFHGRKRELRAFANTLRNANLSNGGTVFLIQGAPGAGKTALLHQCARRAAQDAWRVAVIDGNCLYSATALARRLTKAYAEKTTVPSGAAWKAALSSMVTILRKRDRPSHYARLPLEKILKEAATPGGLVLILDDVQNLRQQAQSSAEVMIAMTQNLNLIHNGRIGAPVILLAAGLGKSRPLFDELGSARFSHDCVRHLRQLSEAAERAVIRDWLVKAGGAHGDTGHLTRWIDTIAAECHAWPQHVQLHAPPAAQWLLRTGGALTEQLPAEVLAQGRKSRFQSYKGRLVGFAPAHIVAMAKLLAQMRPNAPFRRSDLIAAFQRGGAGTDAAAVFQVALRNGVVAERPSGLFEIPIPSMHNWMVQEYANPPGGAYGLAV